jgi:hypothetical protein
MAVTERTSVSYCPLYAIQQPISYMEYNDRAASNSCCHGSISTLQGKLSLQFVEILRAMAS